MRDLTISESCLLLVTKDDGRPESAFSANGYGFAAANIAELVLAGRVDLSDDRDPRVHVVDTGPTGHAALDAALTRLQDKDGKKLSSLVTDGKVAATDDVVSALAERGVIRVEEKRMLGLVPEKRPVVDPTPERALRERLRAVLAGATATPQEATLLAILVGLDLAHKVLSHETSLSKRHLRVRVEEITLGAAAGDVGQAVHRAVAAMNTAIMTAVVLPAVTTTGT